jgi:hypothetical protein
MQKVFTAKNQKEKLAQRKYFFWYQREYHQEIKNELTRLNRKDLLDGLFGKKDTASPSHSQQDNRVKLSGERRKPISIEKRQSKK